MPAIFITDTAGIIRYWNDGPVSNYELETALVSVTGEEIFKTLPGGVTLTPQNPSATISAGVGIDTRIPVKIAAPADGGGVALQSSNPSSGSKPTLYSAAGFKLAEDELGSNFKYIIPAGKTITVYAGSRYINTPASYTVTATFLAPLEPVILTPKKLSAVVSVSAGMGGRIPVRVTAPGRGSVTLRSSHTVTGKYPALFNASGERIASVNNTTVSGYWSYTIQDGQTETVYAGTVYDIALSYTITATFVELPDPVTLTPENPSAVVSVGADVTGRVPIIITPEGGGVALQSSNATPGTNPSLYSASGSRIANDEAGNLHFRYTIGTEQTVTLYAGSYDNKPTTYTVTASFLDAPEPVILTPTQPSSVIYVGENILGRIPITVTTPADGGNVTLHSSSAQTNAEPALYNNTNNRVAYDQISPNFKYTINAGETVTLYAGTFNNKPASYTITATFFGVGEDPNIIVINRERNRNSIVEMAKRFPNSGFNSDKVTRYDTDPSFYSPYMAGSLNSDDIADALNTVKMVRYLAGVPYENVSFTDDLNKIAQHGAVLAAASEQYTHTPTKPMDMSQDFFDLGYRGNSEANISLGINTNSNISWSILGWMADGGDNNIANVGHRRWILKPDGNNFGIGFAGIDNKNYANMHISERGLNRTADTYIAWPSPGDFPIQYFSNTANINAPAIYPWSISLGDAYRTPLRNDIQLTLTRKRDNKVWTFNRNTPELGIGNMPDDSMHLSVDYETRGMGKTIIFRPDLTSLGSLHESDVFEVKLSGINTSDGKATTLEYNINFFDLEAAMATPPTIATTTLPNGMTGAVYNHTLNAISFAPVSWSIDSGSLPGGLTLTANGIISGTPTSFGTYKVIVKATNKVGSAKKELSITIGFTITDIDIGGVDITQKTVAVSVILPTTIPSPAPKLFVVAFAGTGEVVNLKAIDVSNATMKDGKISVTMDSRGVVMVKAFIWNNTANTLSNFLKEPI